MPYVTRHVKVSEIGDRKRIEIFVGRYRMKNFYVVFLNSFLRLHSFCMTLRFFRCGLIRNLKMPTIKLIKVQVECNRNRIQNKSELKITKNNFKQIFICCVIKNKNVLGR